MHLTIIKVLSKIHSMKVLTILILILVMLSGCDTATLDNSELVIDGKRYKLEEVTPSKEDATPAFTTSTANSIRPPVTKHLITDNGVRYLFNSYTYGDTFKVTEYWVEEGGQWVYLEKVKEFPLNARLQFAPSGGEFGSDLPNTDFTCYIHMPDGTYYLIRNQKGIIPLTPDTIRISQYYVQETKGGRWYYNEGTKDLPKRDAKIE